MSDHLMYAIHVEFDHMGKAKGLMGIFSWKKPE